MERIQPIIIYANHADFQQTNVISGLISQGTGGVTEGLKNRIVLPLTGIYKTSNHVLGHELVHAFQFDIMNRQSKKGQPFSSPRLPLWFVEGMAEYYSIGQEDPLTAMWLRDAVLHEDIPTIKDVGSDPKYFPYRWGYAIWIYIGDKWGDKIISSIFREVLWKGWNKGFERIIGMKPDSLSKEWNAHIKETYQPQISGRTEPQDIGRQLFEDDLGFNLAPAISPDGK
ncbi:MAG: peptidase S9, partial [Aliifodinibius sp.]|nr:peptidase S9 [Fodinibius sp.]NIV11563.1 peptidase S9 [Fodinibius sp.]NIY25172.1 peptidase S9 [Fodinibius sp.]